MISQKCIACITDVRICQDDMIFLWRAHIHEVTQIHTGLSLISSSGYVLTISGRVKWSSIVTHRILIRNIDCDMNMKVSIQINMIWNSKTTISEADNHIRISACLVIVLTRRGGLNTICVRKLKHNWFGSWLLGGRAANHCLNQCWRIVDYTHRNTCQWHFN